MKPSLAELHLHVAGLTPGRGVVNARLPGGSESAGLSLGGFVRGPRCSRGSTLPTTYRFAGEAFNISKSEPVGNLSGVKAQALVTDPIFWSPDWPALYDVTVELRRGSDVIEQATRTIGLRPLSSAGKYLTYAGKTWVLRGIFCDCALHSEISQFREAAAALVAPGELLDERLLTEASEEGVLVVAQLTNPATAAAELTRLSRFAAVAIAVLPPGEQAVRSDVAQNILLAHAVAQAELAPPSDDARLALGEVRKPNTFAEWAGMLRRPVMAFRPLGLPTEIAAARRECDRLQRDLAPYGQFAGYIV